MKSIDVLLSIDEVLSRIEQGDMVELVAANGKLFAGFYCGKKEIEPTEDEPTIGHQQGKEQMWFGMANPLGIDLSGRVENVLDDLPEFYMSRDELKGGLAYKTGGYRIEEFAISQGRFLEEKKFTQTNVKDLASTMAELKGGAYNGINTLLRLTFQGERNHVLGYVTATDKHFIHLLSPSTDSRECPIFVNDFGEGPVLYSPIMDYLSWGAEENQRKMMPIAIIKVPVLKVEYYAE